MRFLGRAIDAIIFDMDGVLLDSEPLHFQVVCRILAEEGASISEEYYKRYMGTTLEYTWSDVREHCGLVHPYEHYVERYEQEILEVYRTQSVANPGADELLRALKASDAKVGLASSSNRTWVDTCLEGLGFAGYFEASVAGDEVTMGKPAPEIYLEAAARLQIEPAACLVIEDAPHGVSAAKAATMLAVAVDTDYTRDIDIPQADLRVQDLEELLRELAPALEEAAAAGAR